jgi:hypothetical protein
MWNAIGYVTTGLTLLAFAIAVGAWLYRSRLVEREKSLRALPEADRAKALQADISFFLVDTEHLTREQKVALAMEQIQARERRFNTLTKVVAFIAVLLAGVSAYAISRPSPGDSKTPSEKHADALPDKPNKPDPPAYEVRASVLGKRVKVSTATEPFSKPAPSTDVGCEEGKGTSVSYDFPAGVTIASHNARWDSLNNIKSHEAHSELKDHAVVATGSINGLDKQVFNCPGGGHGTLVVFGTLNRSTESSEPSPAIAIGTSELRKDTVTFSAPSDADLRIEKYRIEMRPQGSSSAFTPVDVPVSESGVGQIQQTQFGTAFRIDASGRTLKVTPVLN